MVVDVLAILTNYGASIVSRIQQNLASTGTNATGKTSKSLRYEVTQEGNKATLRITGKPFFKVVETGRKATPQYKPSKYFVESIREWVKARGIPEGAAYAIAKSIHEKGTPPTNKQIFSNVINESLTDKINTDLLSHFTKIYAKNLVDGYNSN